MAATRNAASPTSLKGSNASTASLKIPKGFVTGRSSTLAIQTTKPASANWPRCSWPDSRNTPCAAGERREPAAQGVFLESGHEHLGQFADAGFVVWIANVDDLPVTNPFGIFNDAVEAFDPFSDVGEAAFLVAAIDQED